MTVEANSETFITCVLCTTKGYYLKCWKESSKNPLLCHSEIPFVQLIYANKKREEINCETKSHKPLEK
jgi:hypothetical protein